MTIKRFYWPVVALAVSALPVSAQLPQASASALGVGFNTTASARGFSAITNNPAGLGHPGTGAFSLAVPALTAQSGLGPVTLLDLAEWEDRRLPDATKTEWLSRVDQSGGQTGSLDAGVTAFALQLGSIGFQLSSVAGGSVALAPDAVELYLYGNAGRTGMAEDFDLEGSAINGFGLTTAAVAFGMKLAPGIYGGATGKYTVGHGIVMGRSQGTTLGSDPLELEVDFPVIVLRTEDPELKNGSGLGLDVGVIIDRPGVSIGARIENIVSTFEWSLDGLSYVPAQALFNSDGQDSDFDERPASEAPADLLAEVAEATIKPVFSAGIQLEMSPQLSVTADLRKRVEGGLALGPAFHAGVGAEVKVLPFLPLRGHLAKVSGGLQVGGGASIVLGPVNLTGAGAMRTSAQENSVLGALTLSFGAN